jgi:hypothetical protein
MARCGIADSVPLVRHGEVVKDGAAVSCLIWLAYQGSTMNGSIMSLSSCSTMWQWWT